MTTRTEKIITEIRECLHEETQAGRVLDFTDTEVRIEFKDTYRAAGWISDYGYERPGAARFESLAADFDKPVIVIMEIAAYDYMG